MVHAAAASTNGMRLRSVPVTPQLSTLQDPRFVEAADLALKWAYWDGAKLCRRCRYIISRSRGRVFVAEITIVEIVSALAISVRTGKMSVAAAERANLAFLRDVAAGKITVLRLNSSELVACRHLLTLVGIRYGRGLKTQDAMVAYTARRLALEAREMVTLLTSDKTLAAIVREVDAFHHLVRPFYLDPS